ncbi:MAG TPA: dihydrodipicolinate synthase family protein [Methylococcaceae bacterium]|jgi:4-hydroxy-tetrahydrodipicolinate synthase|nr:dihydrodipicolinate synthase family protein [Methylococcaceae bacterium]
MSETAPLSGLWCATLTPLGQDLRVDQARLATHVQGLFAEGVAGIVLFGTMGEGPSFPVEERVGGLEGLLASGISTDRIVPATGCAALADTLALTRHALQMGCPRCLILPPFFWKDLSDEAVFRYYATLIDRVNDERLRVYLYHIPQLSAVPIRPDVVARLAAAYPGIVAGVKDSSGDFEHTAALLKCVPQLSIMGGCEPQLPQLRRAGGAGTICGVANLLPGAVAALLKPEVSPDDQSRIQSFVEIVFRYPFVSSVKAIRAAQTNDDGWSEVLPPLLPLNQAERESLFAALHRAGFASALSI